MKKMWIAAALALGGGVAVAAQEGHFSSSVQLVEVYATVTDARGELVTGLKEEDFEVYEDNQRQDISAFSAGEFPLTVALGMDRSWSMAGEQRYGRRTEALISAARNFEASSGFCRR